MPTNASTKASAIPVWSRSIGSWQFSIGRHPFAAHELEGHYDRASDSWHATVADLGFEAAYDGLVEAALPRFPDHGSGLPIKVLDVGIGTGSFAIACAKQCLRPVSLTGIDVSSEMLRRAEQNLRDTGLSAELIHGDVNDLPFEDCTFDVILVAHVVEHMANPITTLAELHRVVKPGGVLLACITQQSSAGAYIQLKCRTHRVETSQALRWLTESGFESASAVTLSQSRTAMRFSKGYVAQKPVAINPM